MKARRDGRNDRAASEGSAGAWAAAALVLGLGGLLCGVVAQLRISDLEGRLDAVEVESVEVGELEPIEEPSTEVDDDAAQASTTTEASTVPGDIVDARQGVIDAYTIVYDGSATTRQRLARIDDPSGVETAMAFAASGEVGENFSRTRARVDDVTFTSSGDATVRYRVLLDGVPTLQARIGAAVLDEGVWKVTRETVCADLEEVGAPCDI